MKGLSPQHGLCLLSSRSKCCHLLGLNQLVIMLLALESDDITQCPQDMISPWNPQVAQSKQTMKSLRTSNIFLDVFQHQIHQLVESLQHSDNLSSTYELNSNLLILVFVQVQNRFSLWTIWFRSVIISSSIIIIIVVVLSCLCSCQYLVQ